MRAGLFLIAAVSGAPVINLARAETPVAAQDAQEKSVAAFGDDKPACLEWTDGCIVCRKEPREDPSCSTAGTACLPAPPTCTKTRP